MLGNIRHAVAFYTFFTIGSLLAGCPAAIAQDQSQGQLAVGPGDQFSMYGTPTVDLYARLVERRGGSPGSGRGPGGSESAPMLCPYKGPDLVISQAEAQAILQKKPMPIYLRRCDSSFDRTDTRLVADAVVYPGTPSSPVVHPVQLIRQAVDQLVLPTPVVRHSPDLRLDDGTPAVLVGEQTWIWTDKTIFSSVSRRVQVGSVWAEVTATPTQLVFDPGDGHRSVVCRGSGTPYVIGKYGLHDPSPDCNYVYTRSSYGYPNNMTTATYSITWTVSWTGSTGTQPTGGQLPDMTSRTAARFAVAEAQALVTNK